LPDISRSCRDDEEKRISGIKQLPVRDALIQLLKFEHRLKTRFPIVEETAFTLATLCLLGSCAAASNRMEEKEIRFSRPPNIVLLTLDDANNWIGAWGGQAKTPNIDRLASQGRMFYNAHCVAPLCNPSRTALLTGQRPETTGQYGNDGNFRDKPGGNERITLPQFLNKNGYFTAAAGKIFHGPRGEENKPDSLSDDISWDTQWVGTFGTPSWDLYWNEAGYSKWLRGREHELLAKTNNKNPNFPYLAKYCAWGPIPDATEECGDWKVMDFGVEFLKENHARPFFLALGTQMPHSPQIVPQKYFNLYPSDEIKLPDLPSNDMDDIPAIAKSNQFTVLLEFMKEMGEYKNAIHAYLAATSFADECVGHFLKALDNSEYGNNTIVIFLSDHGWQLGHKNRWEKATLWRQSTQSPMIIRLPEGMIKPGVTYNYVSFLDIFPTLTDLLGYEKPSFLEGHSLLPILKNPDFEWEYPAVVTNQKDNHSVLFENWNYIRYRDGSEELYNHSTDPGEYTNLAAQEKYKDLIDKMAAWIPSL
jgi:arylsulfatase A-like enzyme